jgi:hypothetical protein
MSREGGDGGWGAIGAQSARPRHGHVRSSRIASAAGGGWTPHDPSPGGAMEERLRLSIGRKGACAR